MASAFAQHAKLFARSQDEISLRVAHQLAGSTWQLLGLRRTKEKDMRGNQHGEKSLGLVLQAVPTAVQNRSNKKKKKARGAERNTPEAKPDSGGLRQV